MIIITSFIQSNFIDKFNLFVCIVMEKILKCLKKLKDKLFLAKARSLGNFIYVVKHTHIVAINKNVKIAKHITASWDGALLFI